MALLVEWSQFMRFFVFSFAVLTFAQTPASVAVRENYSKFEYRIPMRDGVKIFTSVYVPKDVFSDGKTYPIMMDRTPYSVG
ncbi:MAG: hypothetical protein WA642_13240, partial [Steroidobacteraceae bacterium]